VRLDNVHFGYTPDREVLRGVSLEAPPGSTLALVGPSGCGKSTVLRLLFRFYDPSRGRALIDGQDLRHVTAASLRQSISVVPQDVVLLHDTLESNLRYANPDATHQQLLQAIEAAGLTSTIARLPDGLATRVGERGLKLSGGEKQRVAIARCLLKRARLILCDEATSALDSATEAAVLSALARPAASCSLSSSSSSFPSEGFAPGAGGGGRGGGHTRVVVAHRLATVAAADSIAVLREGRVQEQGTHHELLARGGLYADMWDLQSRQAPPPPPPP